MTTTTSTGAPSRRWAGLLLAALAAVLAFVLPAGTASASSLPAAQTRVGAIHPAVVHIVGVAEHIAAGQHLGRAPSQLRLVSGHCVAAEDAGAAGRIGYHATKPEFAQSIRQGGFRESAGGRLGGGGTYVSHDPETALAEYGYHNPGGPTPELLRVRYNPGEEFVFDEAPSAPYFKGIMPPEWADTLTAPSLRNPGGWNSLVRGPLDVLP